MTEIKTVRLHPNIHMRLQSCGRFGESYDTLINRLIDEHEQVSETKNEESDNLNPDKKLSPLMEFIRDNPDKTAKG